MPFPQAFLDELTVRNPIEDVVSQYVSLTRKGGNLFGLCPFHSEKTPSFSEMALDAAGIARRCVWDCVDISCSYAFLERARLELAAQDGEELSTEFAADVLLHGCIPQEKLEALTVRLRELSAGTVLPKKTGSIYRAEKVKK